MKGKPMKQKLGIRDTVKFWAQFTMLCGLVWLGGSVIWALASGEPAAYLSTGGSITIIASAGRVLL